MESSRFASRLKFVVEGANSPEFVRWNPFLAPPPDLGQLPADPNLRVRFQFPFENRDVLDILIYLKLPDGGSATITRLLMSVEEVSIAEATAPGDKNTLGLFGKVIDDTVPSSVGPIVGKPLFIGGAFDSPGPSTRFELFGGEVAGSHVAFVLEGFGSLEIKGPWSSFQGC